MSQITRRSFVKRTGGVTLGAALGLGLLPSVTRKLHATDSSVGEGIKFGYTEEVTAGPYALGTCALLLRIEVSSSFGNGNCGEGIGTVVVNRIADVFALPPFSILSGSVVVKQTSKWRCVNGVLQQVALDPGEDAGGGSSAFKAIAGLGILVNATDGGMDVQVLSGTVLSSFPPLNGGKFTKQCCVPPQT
jgi:hypothetical protein